MRLNLLIDLSGTLHVGDTACAGAVAAVRRLSRAKAVEGSFAFRFCSNTTKESTQDLQQRLIRAGFEGEDVSSRRITTSLEACMRLCVSKRWKPLLLLTSSAQETFRRAYEAEKTEEQATGAFFADPRKPPNTLTDAERGKLRSCDTVVIGLAPDLFNARWLDEAFRILAGEYGQGETRLVATHRALYVRPAPNEALSMGPGAYVAALEAATRRDREETIVCGKPSETFLRLCISVMDDEHDEGQAEDGQVRNMIVGDDVDADLGGGAITMGFERILVKTGKYRTGDEERSSKDDPVKVYESFAEFVDRHLFEAGLLQEGQ